MRNRTLTMAALMLLSACGPPVAREGVTYTESPTFREAAKMAESCYQAVEGELRELPRELEVVTVWAGEACQPDAVACARADYNVVYLVEGEYQRAPVEALAHEFVHVLLYPDSGLDGEAQHRWLEDARQREPEHCGRIPARRMSELQK